MRASLVAGLGVVGWLLFACTGGKYDKLMDASPQEKAKAEALWQRYLKALGETKNAHDYSKVAVLYARSSLAATEEDEFTKALTGALRRLNTKLFQEAVVKALKSVPEGLILVVTTKGGEFGIPLSREGEELRFSELKASSGDWASEVQPKKVENQTTPSLFAIKVLLRNESAPIGERIRAALVLAERRNRDEILVAQKEVSDPFVRLALALARVRIDGSDDTFLLGFPTDTAGLTALQAAEPNVYTEMITKLGNLGANVEDPPANEVLFKVVAAAPPSQQEVLSKALYKMAELNPARFVNAIHNLVSDLASDPGFAVYLMEWKRQGGKAPELKKFLDKFVREGEPREQTVCKNILDRLAKERV